MGRLVLLLSLLFGASAMAQNTTRLWVNAPESLAVNELWPLVVHWGKVPFKPPYNLRLDAPSYFTMLKAPANLEEQGGSATLWMSTAPFTPMGEYELCVFLEPASSLLPSISTCISLRVEPAFRVFASVVDQYADSVRYYLLNEGNTTVIHEEHMIHPGEGKNISRPISTEEELVVKINDEQGSDTVVIFPLRKYIPSVSEGNIAPTSAPNLRYSIVQNTSSGKILRPRFRSTMRFKGHTLSLRNTAKELLAGVHFNLPHQDLRIGYDWYRPTPFTRAELTPYVHSKIHLSAFSLQLAQGWGVANYALEHRKVFAQHGFLRSQVFVARTADSWLPGGSLQFSSGHHQGSIFVQPGLAHFLWSNTSDRQGITISGAVLGNSQTAVPFRNHVNLVHYGRLSSSFRYQANLSNYQLHSGLWAQQASLWSVITTGSWRSSFSFLHHNANFATSIFQGQTGFTIGPLSAGIRAQFRSKALRSGPFLEFNKGNIQARTVCSLNPNGRVENLQSSARIMAAKGLGVWFTTTKTSSGPFRFSSTLTKNTNNGQISLTLRPDASMFCAWRGALSTHSPAKKIRAKCLDQNDQPIEGIELQVDGRLARSDAHGNLCWRNITFDSADYQLQISSVPFGMVPQFNIESTWHLPNRLLDIRLKFQSAPQIRGEISVRSTSAFTPQVTFTDHHILLQSPNSPDRWFPIMPDGSFVLTQLPTTSFSVVLQPIPKGFAFAPVQVHPGEYPSSLRLTLEELTESIPFQSL